VAADVLADVLADVAALDPQAARLRTVAPASAAAAMVFFIIWFSLASPPGP
jgi:ABC-type transport system involved in cytochrome bd biosynthesis fused ATPase/permease subunit